MRLLSWLLCAAAAIVPVITSEEKSIARPKRESSDKKIVCYYTNWSVYRPGTAKFTPQNINPYLCTHLIYAFGGLSKDNALKPFDKYQDIEQGGYAKFNGLKTYNKNLKTMLAIGGWNEGSARFSPLVADAERRKELVKNTVKFLRQNHFDGLDLDWEYPSFRDGGKPRDRDNYATLVQEFREEFERESEKTGRPRLLLTMAVPAGIEYIDKGYDVPKLNRYLDWMNILSYDYHSAFEPAINHHSPLLSMEEDDEYNFDAQLNIDYTVQHYIKLGADRSKLVLGIPTYGRSYTLFNPDATDIGSPADGPGEQGEATREKGYLAYYEICERVKSGGWTIENPNPEAMGPYAYKDNQWVGFDDEDIARAKAKYVNDNDLGGIMFWSIDNDDFRGKCHGKPYPLIEAAKEALLANANELVPTNSRSQLSRSNSKKHEEEQSSKTKPRKTRLRTKSSTTTESSKTKSVGRSTTTPQPPTTPDPGSDFVCKDEGFFPHPRDCKKYFWCLDSGPSSLGIVAHQFTCPSGLVFNKISDSCDYARNVICKTKTEASTTTTTTTTSTTTSRTTTARSRLVITATPPRTTTTTTTEQPDEEEEEDEEDPGTIKELINLIKKLGGVEQLEKQLNIQNSDEKEKIKPSLYSKVLQGRTANRYRGLNDESSTTKYVSAFRNRPVEPQSPSTEETSTGTRGQEKPRYVTIQRNRPTKRPSRVEEESEEEDEEVEVEAVDQEQPKQRKGETPRPFRRRQNTDTTTEKEYVVLRRSRPKNEEDVSTPKYKNIVRVRSTTEAPAEEEEEDDVSEEQVEEEGDDEEEREEIESGQKLKKYSAIIRDGKKVVSDEEETKVSGSQGLQYSSGVSSPTTDYTLDGRDSVNNVNTVTSPRYVEIRRTQSTTTEPPEYSVNNVNNSHENDRENKQVLNETNEVTENESETKENEKTDFQRRFTTEIFKRPTRPSITSLILEHTTPLTAEPNNKDSEVTRFRGRFRSTTPSESISTPGSKPINRYRTLNRSNPEKPVVLDRDEPNPSAINEKISRATPTTENSSPTSPGARRFKFALRTKPTILSPKSVESTTQVFTITVPDLPNTVYTDNSLGSSTNSPSFPPAATLEPFTATSPTFVDNTLLDVPENEVALTTFAQKRFPATTRHVIPTTSTQTSVVTSITESSFTERRRISVPKKARFNSESVYRFSTSAITTEPPFETTKPLFRSSGYKSIFRSTSSSTPKVETTTEARRRRFKSKSTTTTTTTTEEPEKRYVPKKIRNFKKIISTEAPEVPSSTTERTRFFPRNKLRQVERVPPEPSNSLYVRLGNSRRKKVVSHKDDLDADQTSTFVGGDLINTDRYILGGGVKQTSAKDFLNADIFFITVPTVQEEESSSAKTEELTNSIELTKLTVPLSHTNNKSVTAGTKEPVRSRFIKTNTNLRNLRTRTRNLGETTEKSFSTVSSFQPTRTRNLDETEEKSISTVSSFQSTRTRNLGETTEKSIFTISSFQPTKTTKETVRSNFYTSNPNLVNLRAQRTRAQQINVEKKREGTSDSTVQEAYTKEVFRSPFTTPGAKTNVKYSQNRNSEFFGNSKETTEEEDRSDEKLNTREPSSFNFYSSNLKNLRAKSRAQKVNDISKEVTVSTIDSNQVDEANGEEPIVNNLLTPSFRQGRTRTRQPGKVAESSTVSATESITQERNFRNQRARTNQFNGSVSQKITEATASTNGSPSPTGSTKEPTSLYTSNPSQSISETRTEENGTEGVKFRSTYVVANTGEPVSNNFIVDDSEEPITTRSTQRVTGETGSTISSATSGTSSTFGTKITTKSGFTVSSTGFTVGPTVGSSSGSTVSSTTALKPSSLTEGAKESTRSTFFTVSPTQASLRASRARSRFNQSESATEPTSSTLPLEPAINNIVLSKPSSSIFRTRTRQNVTTSAVKTDLQEPILNNVILSKTKGLQFRVVKIRTRGRGNATESDQTSGGQSFDEIAENEKNGRTIFPKDRRRVVARTRPIQSTVETKEKEDEDVETPEAPPSSTTLKTTSKQRGNQEYFTSLRSRARSATQPSTTSERPERRRSQLVRGRIRGESKSTTSRPEIQTETSTISSRVNNLRRRIRPTTSTTTTTTTTEEPYIEQQEDSRLEESKALDETPGIQDLADPAVVAIHNLATVSPGPIGSGGTSLKFYSETPATYTVHVTPSDIASFSTPTRISTVTPGTVSSRPASILTLKPYTIPVITKQYIKQAPVPIRTPSPFRGTGIAVATEEPYSSRSEILIQSRKQETTQRAKPAISVASTSQKETTSKSKRVKPFSKVSKQEAVQSVSSPETPVDYEYYDDDEDPLANIPASALKVKVHSDGYIECLDRGNFPHPFSCKKFISCAKMENNELLGWEYTCPKHLSFDPVGGICNWSAGLGCQH